MRRRLSLFIFRLICLSIFATTVAGITLYAINGGPRLNEKLRSTILAIARFPLTIKEVVSLRKNFFSPVGAKNKYQSNEVFQGLTNFHDGYLLVSNLSSNGVNEVLLINLSNNFNKKIYSSQHKQFHEYSALLRGSDPLRQSAFSSRYRIWHPHLSANGSLTFILPWNDLVSVDLQTGIQKWRVYGAFHHSIEQDHNGNYWVCGAVDSLKYNIKSQVIKRLGTSFEDQVLVQISDAGKILNEISVSDLLVSSGLEYLIFGSSNPKINYDPIHLNQITPIIKDAGIFKIGYLLISLRNLSTVMLVDPIKKAVIWHKCGPWMNQHSVFPTGVSTFSILDNHAFASGNPTEYWLADAWKTLILEHNIETGETKQIPIIDLNVNNLRIPIEGRAVMIIPNVWMIEDSSNGAVLIYKEKHLAYKWSNLYPDGSVGIVSWSRYLEAKAIPNFLK
jgi:hypothetical protein